MAHSTTLLGVLCAALFLTSPGSIVAQVSSVEPLPSTPDLMIEAAQVRYLADLDLLVFEQRVEGAAGATIPKPRGRMHGAPVLGYVFPTTLAPEDVGFRRIEGTVALAVTSHPDFDDTPLWDENGNRDYGDDGPVFHTHWVVLAQDERVPGGLSVVQIAAADAATVLPPTNPGMPMAMDSPGFSVLTQGATLRVLVPAQRVGGAKDFRFDAVTAYLVVNTEDEARPMLGVYGVYSVLSKDLSLPYTVKH